MISAVCVATVRWLLATHPEIQTRRGRGRQQPRGVATKCSKFRLGNSRKSKCLRSRDLPLIPTQNHAQNASLCFCSNLAMYVFPCPLRCCRIPIPIRLAADHHELLTSCFAVIFFVGDVNFGGVAERFTGVNFNSSSSSSSSS